MSGLPTPPIVVDEHGDISLYPSMAAARDEMESVDVAAAEYEVFDSCGYRLDVWVESNLVEMALTDETLANVADLRRRQCRDAWANNTE